MKGKVAIIIMFLWGLGGCYNTENAYVQHSREQNYWYPLVYFETNYKSMTNLDKDIALFYANVDTPPDDYIFIVHGLKKSRSKNCENATIDALKALQEDAKKLGANAIVNLTPAWEGQSLRKGKRYTCAGGAVTYGIDWEGDFVKMDEEVLKKYHKGQPVLQSDKTETSASQGSLKGPSVVISIDKDGKIIFEGQTISREQLKNTLEETFKKEPGATIIIRSDKETKSDNVVDVEYTLQVVGFKNILKVQDVVP